MQTKRWYIDERQPEQQAIEEAADRLRNGRTVAFPTETVYGLGADATDEAAVSGIFEAKGRPEDNPLIAHVATKKQLSRLVTTLPSVAEKLIDTFTPGPITIVLPSNGTCASNVTAGLSTIGVRIPDHPVAQNLLKTCDIPVAAPSANISGKPSPTTADHVWADLQGKIAGLVDAGATGVGLESTVIDCTQEIPVILRPGGITKAQLEMAVGSVMVDPALANTADKPKAPGMKYKHYAPDVPMWLVAGSPENIQAVIDRERDDAKRIGVMASTQTANRLQADRIITLGSDLRDIAATLYDALRVFKNGDVDLIVCETFPRTDIGQAIMNRLEKAATAYVDS
ncbi:L-threonylcarbamoyladenylate synthase [Lentibacillus sp. CBA3610]|uniref:L-threonylcarbamoyladenylate synthase n=1 Tax=Lentibacillus sp. CBA3610 TaxID=2518176 RepID=UPI001595A95C|nr:L-threonylcarbamoyladenylate synthase [Lentibacillus sp. CBA3610]QKY70486.1 threonylcarbamoyl-AMP synthase [Lentibacillus sp. CBA3610]